MNNEIYETTAVDQFFDNNTEKYEISELIQERAVKARTFALITMIVSGVCLILLLGSFAFSLFFPSFGLLALFTLPLTILGVVIEVILMIGAIAMNIIALVNANNQKKELKHYVDGPEKERLRSTVQLGQVFTYIGVGVAALALVLIFPLNLLEIVLSIA